MTDAQPAPSDTPPSATRNVAASEVALGVIGRALSRGPSPTRESASSGPVQKINSTLIAIDATSVRWRGRIGSYLTHWSVLHRSTEGAPGCLASCSGLVPYLPPIPWGTPEARVESAPPTTEASVTPGPAAAAPPAAKRARNSE